MQAEDIYKLRLKYYEQIDQVLAQESIDRSDWWVRDKDSEPRMFFEVSNNNFPLVKKKLDVLHQEYLNNEIISAGSIRQKRAFRLPICINKVELIRLYYHDAWSSEVFTGGDLKKYIRRKEEVVGLTSQQKDFKRWVENFYSSKRIQRKYLSGTAVSAKYYCAGQSPSRLTLPALLRVVFCKSREGIIKNVLEYPDIRNVRYDRSDKFKTEPDFVLDKKYFFYLV